MLLRAQPAADPHGRDAKPVQRTGHTPHCGTGGRAAGGVKIHRDPDRQVGLLPDRQYGGTDISQISHCLDHHQIGARPVARAHHLSIALISSVKGQRTQRLQRPACRTHIQSDLFLSVVLEHGAHSTI